MHKTYVFKFHCKLLQLVIRLKVKKNKILFFSSALSDEESSYLYDSIDCSVL